MNPISNFECPYIEHVQIGCMMVDGEPWFKGIDVAKALEYKNHSNTVSTKVPLKFRSSLRFLLSRSRLPRSSRLDANELNTSWINEAGLYKLVLKSTMKLAEVFQDWVCAEVIPSIRKTGSYNHKYFYSKPVATKDDVRQLALKHGREDELHYRVVDHIKNQYPDAVIHAGLGEHLTTKHARMDAYLKGYTKGEPDITVIRKLPNSFQDVLAIELKNPNGKGVLDDTQMKYHQLLNEQCNIETIVGHEYDKIIIQIALHYQEVFSRARLPAITDKPQNYDFSTNQSPQYWCNKLKNKQGLVDECTKRQIPDDGIWIKTNREIASILITFDTNA
jgi:prophage antirepressor-like protein